MSGGGTTDQLKIVFCLRVVMICVTGSAALLVREDVLIENLNFKTKLFN